MSVHSSVIVHNFPNRRSRSPYQKKLFPAGFQVNNVRNELLLDRALGTGDHSTPKPLTAPLLHRQNAILAPISYLSWTKGNYGDDSVSMESEGSDPFADYAGPNLKVLTSLRKIHDIGSIAYIEDPAFGSSKCNLHSLGKGSKSTTKYYRKVSLLITLNAFH